MKLVNVVIAGILVCCICSLILLGGHRRDRYVEKVNKVLPTNMKLPVSLPTKYVLYYTKWFRKPFTAQPKEECSKPCVFTNDSTLLDSVADFDALIFHAPDLTTTEELPDQDTRRDNQVYILVGRESPLVAWVYDSPSYRYFFNWTMLYLMDSDIPCNYGEYHHKKEAIKSEEEFEEELDELLEVKKKTTNLAFWAVSNCNPNRMAYAKELMKHLNVSIYGKCFDKFIEPSYRREQSKVHKFYFSFENAHCKEYITEKFWFALEYETLPIVMGGVSNEHKMVAPPNSFINAKDFDTPKELAEYIKFLDGNDKEYKKYFQWRRYYDSMTKYPTGQLCEICDRLHDANVMPKTYENIAEFYNKDQCDSSLYLEALGDATDD